MPRTNLSKALLLRAAQELEYQAKRNPGKPGYVKSWKDAQAIRAYLKEMKK